MCLTPSFPVSPETPYGKKEEKLAGYNLVLQDGGVTVSFVVLFCPVKTSPRYPPFSPPEPQLSSPASLHKGRGKNPYAWLLFLPRHFLMQKYFHLGHIPISLGKDMSFQTLGCGYQCLGWELSSSKTLRGFSGFLGIRFDAHICGNLGSIQQGWLSAWHRCLACW